MLRARREDQLIEALFSHEEVNDLGYADLSNVLAALSKQGRASGHDDKAALFAERAARIARSGEGGTTRRIRPPYRPLIPRLTTAALAVVLVTGLTGVAVASDAAGPGDSLYWLDRALERIGVDDGGLDERIAEANALVAGGSLPEALDHLADSLSSTPAGAADALHEAADDARETGSATNSSGVIQQEVTGMLEWMSQQNTSAQDFGQGVAEMARGIRDAAAPDPSSPGGTQSNKEEGGAQAGGGSGPPGGSPPGRGGP